MKKYNIGIDSGSRTTKIAVFDLQENKLTYSETCLTGFNLDETARKLYNNVLSKLKLQTENIETVKATGYGRKQIKFADKFLSEIICHAKGILHLFPGARTVIDIGGQDSKVIEITPDGKVSNFVMNDKCAAGTGKFLEMAANFLDCQLTELSELASKSENPVKINQTCVVFSESEIIGYRSKGVSANDIARGVHMSIASRIYGLSSALRVENPVVFTGGVAFNSDLTYCLSKVFDKEITRYENPIITGALGAALA